MNGYRVEYTDTFGGEANYCWVRHAEISVPDGASRSLIMRRAKSAIGIGGARGKTDDYGDSFQFTPYRSCTTMFVTFDYN